MSGQNRVKHTTHLPVERSGFVHYKPGCLCHECVHFLNCRLSIETIAIKEEPDIRVDKSDSSDKSLVLSWTPKHSEATKR
jgi:hypothetical protein